EEPSGNKIAQLDANSGTIGWTVPTAGGRAIAVGPFMGNVYVTGSNSAQAFVTKLDTSGVIQWTKTTSGGTAEGISVAVYDNPNNGSESIYVTGDYLGTVDFDPSSSTFPLTNIPPAKNIQGSGTDIFAWNLNA